MLLNRIKLISSSLALLLITSCANVPLSNIPQTREGYNQALSDSDNQQFLLNIVRMHFGQTPYFVNVDNMVTSSTLTTGSGSNFTNGVGSSPVPPATGMFWSVTPQVTFAQTPTITYTPLQGSQFVSGMLAPITIDKISLLLQSGWSTKEVLKLTVEQIGDLSNGTTVLHPLSNMSSEQAAYNKFVDALDRLDIEDRVDFLTTKYKDDPAVVMNFDDNAAAAEICSLLHLKKVYKQLIFTRTTMPGDGSSENIVFVQTRSFFSMLNFLSRGVASDADMSEKYGLRRIVKSGSKVHSDTSLTEGIFSVYETEKTPNNTAVKIKFDDHWYAISNNDVASKSTLVLLRLTYSLQTGDLKAQVPLITIPTK